MSDIIVTFAPISEHETKCAKITGLYQGENESEYKAYPFLIFFDVDVSNFIVNLVNGYGEGKDE